MKKTVFITKLLLSVLIFSACNQAVVDKTPMPPANAEPYKFVSPENTPTELPLPTPTQIPMGPETYPSTINPLNGLPVKEPANLNLPPVLASISNFPPTARPQAGLSFSPIVFEIFIGDGMTRNLAVFYGDYPGQAVVGDANQPASVTGCSYWPNPFRPNFLREIPKTV